MTLTVEQIEQARETLQKIAMDWSPNLESAAYHMKKVDAICELALIGAAVKPRPISEAPKDGTSLLCWCDMEGGEFFAVLSYEGISPLRPWQTADGLSYHVDVPRFFIPCSALPHPPEQQEPK